MEELRKPVLQGVHIDVSFLITRLGLPENFQDVEFIEARFVYKQLPNIMVVYDSSKITVSDNKVSVIIPDTDSNRLIIGDYDLHFLYKKTNVLRPNLYEPFRLVLPAFKLVKTTAELGGVAPTDLEVQSVEIQGEMFIARDGLNGNSAFEIWQAFIGTPESTETDYLAWLRLPVDSAATDFDALTEEFDTFNQDANTAEGLRNTKEGQRDEAEGTRLVDEQLRKNAEQARAAAEQARTLAEQTREQAEAERETLFDQSVDESVAATAAANAAAAAASLLEPKISDNIEPALAEILTNLNGRMQAFEQLIKTMIFRSLQIDNLDVVKNFTLHGSTNLFLTGSDAPANTPDFAGQYYINTTAGNGYIAVSENVWLKIADAVEVAANSAGMASIKDNQEPAIAVIISHLNGRISALESIIKNSQFKNVQIDTADIVKALNLHGGTNLILIRGVAPAEVPDFIGQTYVNTVAGVAYEAIGTTSVAHWKQKTN